MFFGNRTGLNGAGGALTLAPILEDLYGMVSQIRIDGNRLIGNSAGTDAQASLGGGIYVEKSTGVVLSNNLAVSTISALGGGFFLKGGTHVTGADILAVNNTLVTNQPSGIDACDWAQQPLEMINNIFVGHALALKAGPCPASGVAPTSLAAGYNLFYSNTARIQSSGPLTETGSVLGDPRFVSPAIGDYRLRENSPAVNAGDPRGIPPAPDHDIDKAKRPSGIRTDTGAYEAQIWTHRLYVPVIYH